MTFLRAAALLCVLALATPNSAIGSFVFVDGVAVTANGGTEPWVESKEGSGSPALSITSSHGSLYAEASAVATPNGVFSIFAWATVAASDMHRGPVATAVINLHVTDQVTPTFPGATTADLFAYTQHLAVTGQTSGNATAPGAFDTGAEIFVSHDGTYFVFAFQNLSSETGNSGALAGDLVWTVLVTPTVPFNLRIDVSAFALASAIEDAGEASGQADFAHTFRWGEVTDVINVTTGQPIPASDFHLYGEDGFDWAHPNAASAAVPEPSSLVTFVALGLLGLAAGAWRRKR